MTDDIKWYNKSWAWFAVICTVMTIATVGAFWCWHGSNASRQERIFEVYNKNIENAHNLLKGARKELLDSLRSNPEILLADYDSMERLTKIAEKLSEDHTAASLLEVEANKIQNQYEALGVWAAVITIVFLIFSFYNLFKSEELQREGRAALRTLRDLETKAKDSSNEISNFQTKGYEKLDEFEKKKEEKFNSFKDDAQSKIDEIEKQLSPLENNIKNILKEIEEVKDKNRSELDKTYEDEKLKLQQFIENEAKRLVETTKTENQKIELEIKSLETQVMGLDDKLKKIQNSSDIKNDINGDVALEVKTNAQTTSSEDFDDQYDSEAEDGSERRENEYGDLE